MTSYLLTLTEKELIVAVGYLQLFFYWQRTFYETRTILRHGKFEDNFLQRGLDWTGLVCWTSYCCRTLAIFQFQLQLQFLAKIIWLYMNFIWTCWQKIKLSLFWVTLQPWGPRVNWRKIKVFLLINFWFSSRCYHFRGFNSTPVHTISVFCCCWFANSSLSKWVISGQKDD